MKTIENTVTRIEIILSDDEVRILQNATILLNKIATTFSYETKIDGEKVDIVLNEEVESILRDIVELCHSNALRNI